MDPVKTALADKIINARDGDLSLGFETRDVNAMSVDETFTIVTNADATLSIISPNGLQWVTIELDGSRGFRLISEHPEPGPWEKYTRQGNLITELQKDGITRPLVQFIARDL